MRTFLLGLMCLVPAVGCFSINKAGPLWGKTDKDGKALPTRSKADPKAVIMPPKDAAGPVIEEGGPRPPAPTFSLTAGEITEANAREMAARVRDEMQRDLNAPFPAYPVVSRIQR